MKKPVLRFNTYLTLLLLLAAACRSPEKKEATQLRLFIEVTPDNTGRNRPVSIGRTDPFVINVEKEPFLNEGNVAEVWVVDALGGFQIMLQFDRRGTWLLEQYSTAHKGRRVGILAQFGELRWLAAPILQQRISDGLLVFTPDATREEAERIVRGLKNVAKVIQKHNW